MPTVQSVGKGVKQVENALTAVGNTATVKNNMAASYKNLK